MASIQPHDIVCLVLCAGEGTRLRPLTYTRPKQLLPLCNVPVIDHILSAVKEAGIRHVGMVVGPDARGLRAYVGDAGKWGLHAEWLVQEQARGIGDAVLVAESYVGGRPFVVYLGDALYEGGIGAFVRQFAGIFPTSLLRLTPVEDPRQYGIAIIEDGVIKELEEKPAEPRTNLAITGLYAFPCDFFHAIRKTSPSARGELEITDSIANFLDNPAGVQPEVWEGEWADAGQPHSFLEANRLVFDWRGDLENAAAVDGSSLAGNVGAGEGTIIRGSRVEGPVLLGRECRVTDSQIGPYVSVGDRAVIEGSVVRNTVIDADAVVSSLPCGLEDSIVGRGGRAAGTGAAGPAVSRLIGDNAEERIQ